MRCAGQLMSFLRGQMKFAGFIPVGAEKGLKN